MSIQKEILQEWLVEAICEKKFDTVALLLQQGADPNGVIDQARITPLQFAIIYESIESVLLLISAGADIFQQNDDGLSSIECAITTENIDILAILFFHISRS